MRAGVGYSENPDSAAAGKQAAEKAVKMSGRNDACRLAFLFCTARHDQQALREAVSAVIGASVPIYGGGAPGVITNDEYGYAGNQVGVACLWLDEVQCDALTDNFLSDDEKTVGERLGEKLSGLDVTPDSPVLLFYDTLRRGVVPGMSPIMATWILEGLEKGLGFLPNVLGAGLMGDHVRGLTSQYTGDRMEECAAIALTFRGDIRVDGVVLHGCRPASGYYTVTKADGATILEINREPALDFLDRLLRSAIPPEQYPFSLLFGIHSGKHWEPYHEDKYASRLCWGIDRERKGIIMFEPDMVQGTEFQLMFRSTTLDYMRPKFEAAFHNLRGRKPVFALYIDCAGRCAGYEGVNVEDAVVLQQVVADRVPLLGLYTGVEIAPVAGRPRGLDWTGVFCLFSQGGESEDPPIRTRGEGATPQEEASPASLPPIEALTRMCEQNAARALALDKRLSMTRYSLELKRRGFRLLSELSTSLRNIENSRGMFVWVAERINAALNMQKTVTLLRNADGAFSPAVLQGFSRDERERLWESSVRIPDECLDLCPRIITEEEGVPDIFRQIQEEYALPFYIISPVRLQGSVVAILLTGRMVEQIPYLVRLSNDDMETVQAITELAASVLARLRLRDVTVKAETDGLTGLWNRETFQSRVENCLNDADGNVGAFMMMDLDAFKAVNDMHGHMAGDRLLKGCAHALREVMRNSDIIGRQGGDEFAVFCQGIRNESAALKKAGQIRKALESVIPEHGTDCVTASIGIALTPIHGVTFETLYQNADIALYRAKERGKNRCVLFEPQP